MGIVAKVLMMFASGSNGIGGSPLPLCPLAPVCPVAPLGPVAPIGPVDPTGPIIPLGPVAPVGPLNPVAPVGPLGPVNPVSPAVQNDFHMNQFFWGVAPSPTRVFIVQGATQENNLDVGNVGTSNDFRFGYIDGYRSPLNAPAPETEQWATSGIFYAFGFFNPLSFTTPISPLLRFYIRRIVIGVIRDPQLIARILAGQPVNPGNNPVRLRALGGLIPPSYNMQQKWRVTPLQLNATPEQISASVNPPSQ